MLFQRLRGTKDIYGSEAALFERIERAARETFYLFGFEALHTPILEEKQLYTRALGSETDVVQKEMYAFTDRSETQVALRPEGTAGVVRAYLENNFDKTKGLCKFFYGGPMFRSERPQAGRLREFHQIGVEQLGTESPYADAETIQCLAFFLNRAGVHDFQLKMNNLGTFDERQKFQGVLREYFKPHVGARFTAPALCDDCQRRFEKNVFRILDCKNESCRKIIQKSPIISDYLTTESKDHFATVLAALNRVGAHGRAPLQYAIDPYMVRGLDYYTKTVFEVSHPKLGSQDAVAAGGRYDQLIETFGGPSLGAVGFAVGVERLVICMTPEEKNAEWQNCVFIATLGDAAFQKGFELLTDLRSQGIPCAMDFHSKSLKSLMRSADKNKSRAVIILGDEELQEKKFVLKDMEKGTQEKFEMEQAVNILRARVC